MHTLADIAARFGLTLRGDGARIVRGVGTLAEAEPSQIGFLANPAYRSQLATTRAAAVVVAEKDAAHATGDVLVSRNPDADFARIAALFDDGDTSTFAALDALRTVPSKRMPTELFRHLDRLDAVRAFNLRPAPPRGVPATTLERLARVARVSKPSAIAALQEPRRTATVAALFHTLEAAAQDDAAELAEVLLADLVKGAEAADKQDRLRSLRDLDGAAMLLHAMGLLVLTDDVLPLNEWRDVLFERLPRPDIEAAMSKVEAIAKPAESKPYDQLRRKWRGARKLFFEITNRIETDASALAVSSKLDG